ncbi:hypothetical protein [Jiangella alba]|uniref:hypothetical protein n=1 Tax=Jiangella alba TaxID=561176 RepID=UPI00114D092B|nr:hypothetical protein [Jiangella alba]
MLEAAQVCEVASTFEGGIAMSRWFRPADRPLLRCPVCRSRTMHDPVDLGDVNGDVPGFECSECGAFTGAVAARRSRAV